MVRTLAALLLAVAAAGGSVLATYAGGEVTADELASWLSAHGQTDDPDRRRDALEAIALAETLEAAALAAGLDRQPDTAFRLAESDRGLLAAAVRSRMEREVVIADAAIAAELASEEQERHKPRSVQLRNIFKKTPPGAGPEERAALRRKLEEIRQRLLSGADFDELAYRESDSQTRHRGGAMGYVPPGRLQPAIERVAFALAKGELSEVVETPEGFTILRCDDISDARVMPLEEARAMIRQGLWTRETEARWSALRGALLREAAPHYTEDAPGPDADAPAVTFAGGSVSWADLGRLAHAPPAALSPARRRQVLEEQVFRMLLERRARRDGLDADPTLRARARWARARILATAEMVRRVNAALMAPTDAEVRARYEANRAAYVQPVEVDLSVIRWDLPAEPEGVRAVFAEAEAMLPRLRASATEFAETARRVSREASAAEGGRVGFLTPPQLAARFGPYVFRVASDLGAGETSDLVQQDRELWVVRLHERRPERPQTLAEAAQRVEKEIGDARVASLQRDLEAKARAALRLSIQGGL